MGSIHCPIKGTGHPELELLLRMVVLRHFQSFPWAVCSVEINEGNKFELSLVLTLLDVVTCEVCGPLARDSI